ncbi:MAG TPA: SpoIIE family protein phosphatase, partial [Microthrixaceae bacterium]|nr:SpoIIE family protein phosphatase [Microthrixaceae bacterium]
DPATGEVMEFVGTIKDVTELARAEERSPALAELSARLAGADGVDEVAATALSALAEDLDAQVGFLSLADADDTGSLRVLASRGIGSSGRWQRFSVEVDSPVADSVRTGEVIFIATPAEIDQRYPGLTGWRELGVAAMAHVPFVVRGQTCVLSLGFLESRDLSDDELGWLEEAVVVTASALERAQRFDFERSVANTLQHSLLTTAAHDPSTVQAVHYQPAIVELEVGGDWYDTIRLSDGRVAAATGDAVGRGIRAAAVMGQLQSALAAAALRVGRPHEAVEILDEFSTTVPDAMSATVALAIVDAASQSIDLCRAGHLPPIVVGPDGSIELVEEGGGRPLSIGSPVPRRSVRRHFPPGSLLLLYTDGLVERRGEPIDVGLDRLIEAVSHSWSLPVETFIERVLDDLMTGSARTDDVALVALRPVGAAPRLLVQQLAAVPAALAPARAELRDWLTDQHLSTDEVDMVLLAVGEACSNSIEHGYRGTAGRPSDDSTVQVEISREDDHLLAAVSDRGSWRDPSSASDPNRGRGIALMRSIMDEVVIRTNVASTTVTMRFPLRSGVNDLVMPS